jgi:HD-GYP domain-containing protein (c-di-GMP phosphodiesterase class II)
MSLELCEMTLQQTKDLLRLIDLTLQNICCKRFTSDEFYVEVLGKVLGGNGRRGPASIFIVSQPVTEQPFRGRVYHLHEGTMERSAEVIIEPTSSYATNLALTEAQAEVVAVNWRDSCNSIDEFQIYFHPAIKAVMETPLTNFVTCRISGDSPSAIIAFNYPGRATDYDADVLRSGAVVIGSLVTLSGEVRETEKAFIYTIEALARACEAAEADTGRHILRVNRYSGALAANMGLAADFVETISYSAQMHDVGKIKIPTAILLKEDLLTFDEMQLIKMHPSYGEQILGDSPRLQVAREIAISHHENWDGSGYPHGLKGDSIPIAGRIVKIADVYDALRSKRSYKSALSHRQAMAVFVSGDERICPECHFDPEMLATFFKIEHIFEMIYDSSGAGGDV